MSDQYGGSGEWAGDGDDSIHRGQAPPPPPAPAAPPAPTKKRWPWIVGGLLLLCGLPLGGCIALIGVGVNSISNVNDEIRASTDAFVTSWNAGDPSAHLESSCFEGEFPPIDWLIPGATELAWTEDGIAFVERSANGFLASNADAESSTVPGFEDHDNAWIDVTFTDTGGAGSATAQLTFVDTQSDDRWELCGISGE